MQNKGLVKLFALLFGLVSIYQLSFTFKNRQIEQQAKDFAVNQYADDVPDYNGKRAQAEFEYLDSLSTTKIGEGEEAKSLTVFDLGIAEYSYNEVKDRAMNLGLDLKGGINVILQISVRDILEGLSNKSKDPIFIQALDNAEEAQKNSQNTYLDDFYTAFDAIKGNTKLASPDIFANRTLRDEVNSDMDDDDVKQILNTKIDESIVSAYEVLRKRIDKFGVTSPNIQRLGNSGRILLELPGAKDKERVKDLVTKTAQLQFWDAYKIEELSGFLAQANETLKTIVKTDTTTTGTTTEPNQQDKIDDLLGGDTSDVDSTNVAKVVNPLFDLIKGGGAQGGPVLGLFSKKDKGLVSQYLNMPQIKALLSTEQTETMFVWGKEDEDEDLVELYGLKGNREGVPELSGDVITDASNEYSPNGEPNVGMQMNSKGAKIWEQMTKRAYEQRSQIAIVLDSTVYSAPGVTNGPIDGGNSQISGDFTLNEAIDLANVLRAGKLPASADIVQADEVGPSLGQEAIDSGMKSFLIALSLVLIWMVFYYGKAGLASDVALLVNILFIFGVLAAFEAVLTLPGIAGIILTVGIAVDANVLLYERVREELAKGKGQKEAIAHAYSWKGAISSIFDANITTLLTAIILGLFGTGPVQGFAVTLGIGILTSLFTAIFITRLIIDWYVNRGGQLEFSTSLTKGLFRNINIAWLKKRKMAYIVSGLVLLLGLGSLITNGLDAGIDFVGGRTYTIRFDKDVDVENIKEAVNLTFGSAEVKTIGGDNQLKISTKYKFDQNASEIDEEVQRKLYESLIPYFPEGMTYQKFLDADNDVGKMYSGKVSPTIADDIKKSSIWAILGSLFVVFLYILIRFKKWQFSLGAVAAVFHDVLIVLGVFSIFWKFLPFSMEIDQAFIAAILTVIGYSLNDTVVVFDRIREFLNEHTSWEFDRTVNTALNSTLSRTLNTSLTTLVVLLSMFIFGADSLRGLLFALIVGVIVGTYSSVFIATPIMRDSIKKFNKKK